MDSLEEFIDALAGVFIFCFAVSLFFYSSKELGKLLSASKDNLNNHYTLYEQSNTEYDKYVSYTEVIGVLLEDIPYNVQVNELEFTSEVYDYMDFNYTLIPNTNYYIQYYYDDDGNIVKVKYIGI